MGMDLIYFKERFDNLVLPFLGPIRMSKKIDQRHYAELMALMDELIAARDEFEQFPRDLAGELWFIFTTMLAEADHARDPESILMPAWNYEEKLVRFFGPRFYDVPNPQ